MFTQQISLGRASQNLNFFLSFIELVFGIVGQFFLRKTLGFEVQLPPLLGVGTLRWSGVLNALLHFPRCFGLCRSLGLSLVKLNLEI